MADTSDRGDAPQAPVVTVRRYAEVQAVLEDPEGFTAIGAIDCGQRRPLIPLQSSSTDHPRHRLALETALGSRTMARMEPDLRQLANSLIDEFADDGVVDVNAAMAKPFPVLTLMHLLGLPPGDHDIVRGFHDGILGPVPPDTDPTAIETPTAVGERIYDYFEPVVEDRRRAGGPDLISLLLAGGDGSPGLASDEVVDMCYLLVLAGIDPVARALACSIAYFAARPGERARTMAQPREVRRSIDELLRWGSSVELLTRVATRDEHVGDVPVSSGDRVMCALPAANRDPDVFDRPEEVDPARRRPHLAFGSGPHHCVGAHLARLQLRVVLEELHRRLPSHALSPSSADVDPSALTAEDPLLLTF